MMGSGVADFTRRSNLLACNSLQRPELFREWAGACSVRAGSGRRGVHNERRWVEGERRPPRASCEHGRRLASAGTPGGSSKGYLGVCRA